MQIPKTTAVGRPALGQRIDDPRGERRQQDDRTNGSPTRRGRRHERGCDSELGEGKQRSGTMSHAGSDPEPGKRRPGARHVPELGDASGGEDRGDDELSSQDDRIHRTDSRRRLAVTPPVLRREERPYHERMPDTTTPPTPEALPGNAHELAYEAFGVHIGMSTNDPSLLARMRDLMPPGARPCKPSTIEKRFELTVDEVGQAFKLRFIGAGDESRTTYHDLELALGLLSMHMCGYVAVNARDRIFVHAGVVSHRGRLLVLPGESFAGKSTLVRAFMRAGASYYSDEYAVLDDRGRVHPYARPLSLRALNSAGTNFEQTSHTAESLGGEIGAEPRLPTAIVMTNYRSGAEWRPRRLSPGEGVLALLAHTLPARERPEESLRAITSAVEQAIVLQSERGEADEVVPLVLDELDTASP